MCYETIVHAPRAAKRIHQDSTVRNDLSFRLFVIMASNSMSIRQSSFRIAYAGRKQKSLLSKRAEGFCDLVHTKSTECFECRADYTPEIYGSLPRR